MPAKILPKEAKGIRKRDSKKECYVISLHLPSEVLMKFG